MSKSTAIEAIAAVPANPVTVGQITAIEQARAVAEVQAAVVVAQQRPRDITRATGEMRDACGRMALASRAFYAVPNRGNGPTIHLARELARIWGNIDYSVRELRRDDEAGMSEILATAWDQQANVRSSRSFQAPHAKMAKKVREKIVDLDDIYRNNQSVGAKAVRECIWSILPRWFTEEAQDLCHKTLREGEGAPLGERVSKMLDAFRGEGITVEDLEARTGLKRSQWDAGTIAQLAIDYTSITRDGVDKDRLFPPQKVTIEELSPVTEDPDAWSRDPETGEVR